MRKLQISGAAPPKGHRPSSSSSVTSEFKTVTNLEKDTATKYFQGLSRFNSKLQRLDERATGKVSRDEFREALKDIGFDLTDIEFNKFSKRYTDPKFGSLSYLDLNKRLAKLVRPTPGVGLI